MARFSIPTRIWFAVLAALTLVLGVVSMRLGPAPARQDWAILALLGLSAAIAHRFPVKASNQASYRLTNVFLVAGAILLPPLLLPLLILLALAPDSLLGVRGVRILVRLFVNVPPTSIAIMVAGLWLAWFGGLGAFHGLAAVGLLLVAGALATLLQNLLLAVGMALNFRLPLWRTDPLNAASLQGDAVFAILGIAVAGLWRADPALLLLILPVLVLAHRLTRTAHLAQLAQTDAKTGLHNSRHFEEVLAEELARAQRTGRPLAVLFADLDRFKAVNDRYGHDAGDAVLQAFGTLLTAEVRSSDLVARFGGEEFVALLPGTQVDEALYIAERVRAAVEIHPFVVPGGATLRCTVSVGVAAAPQDGTTVEALLRQADVAMYRAKHSRNAVAVAGTLPSVPRVAVAPAPPTVPDTPARPPRRAAFLLWGTVTLGLAALALSLPALAAAGGWPTLATLLLMGVLAELVTVQVFESDQQRFSLSFGIVASLLAMAVLPPAAPLVTFVAASAHVIQRRQWRRGPGRVLFNLANTTLAAGIATGAYVLLAPLRTQAPLLSLGVAAIATVLYYLVNTLAIALTMAAHTGRPTLEVLADARWAAPATLLLGLTGAFIGAQYSTLGPAGLLMLILPLLVMRYTLSFAARKNRHAFAILHTAKVEAEQAHEEKEQTLRQLINVVAAIIDARDQAVSGHSARVATYAVAIGEALALAPRELAYLHTAGLLHDLGKIAVPEAILHKPASLTEEEFAVVKEHAGIGERILAEVQPLEEVARIVGDHHERFDGSGYPHGEAGSAISLGGRIVAVADTLDSILSDRPYSQGRPLAWALSELARCAGTHFDAVVVEALQQVVAERGAGFFVGGPTPVAPALVPPGFFAPIAAPHASEKEEHVVATGR